MENETSLEQNCTYLLKFFTTFMSISFTMLSFFYIHLLERIC